MQSAILGRGIKCRSKVEVVGLKVEVKAKIKVRRAKVSLYIKSPNSAKTRLNCAELELNYPELNSNSINEDKFTFGANANLYSTNSTESPKLN